MVEQSESETVNSFVVDDFDRDSLHTLPLSMIPLETSGLKRALMIKNARYEGVVELFKAEGSGSGQVEVGQLANVFNNIAESDLIVLGKLAELPSYDVYSLRIMLREQNIPVNDFAEFKLSDNKARELNEYMRSFTRPLLLKVYGTGGASHEFADVIDLFRQPDVSLARNSSAPWPICSMWTSGSSRRFFRTTETPTCRYPITVNASIRFSRTCAT